MHFDNVSDEIFNEIMAKALDELPVEYTSRLNNVLITFEDNPSAEQLLKQGLGRGQTLLGLYEGIPLTKRGAGYTMVLPDKITLYKYPIIRSSHDEESFKAQIKHTLWHEIAHYFGLGHDRIHEIESRWQ
ncbi:MAG: metallopeptidase family protein [bacterium]|nr:metallopeptidase family protein [bacterium]